jgi:hypothetical protein
MRCRATSDAADPAENLPPFGGRCGHDQTKEPMTGVLGKIAKLHVEQTPSPGGADDVTRKVDPRSLLRYRHDDASPGGKRSLRIAHRGSADAEVRRFRRDPRSVCPEELHRQLDLVSTVAPPLHLLDAIRVLQMKHLSGGSTNGCGESEEPLVAVAHDVESRSGGERRLTPPQTHPQRLGMNNGDRTGAAVHGGIRDGHLDAGSELEGAHGIRRDLINGEPRFPREAQQLIFPGDTLSQRLARNPQKQRLILEQSVAIGGILEKPSEAGQDSVVITGKIERRVLQGCEFRPTCPPAFRLTLAPVVFHCRKQEKNNQDNS